MIRVMALAYWAERQGVTAEEARLMTSWSEDYIKLFKVLPWTNCSNDWRQLVYAQKLCGIKSRFINEHREQPLSNCQFARLKKYCQPPDAWITRPEVVETTYDNYAHLAKGFWHANLQPIQLPTVTDKVLLSTHTKFCLLSKTVRSAPYTLWYRDNSRMLQFLQDFRSLPTAKTADIKQQANDMRYRRMCGLKGNNGWMQYNPSPLAVQEQQDRFVKQYETEINKLFSLFMKCQCEGFINDKLMEVTNYDELIHLS